MLSGSLYQSDQVVLIDSWLEVVDTQFIPSIRTWVAPYLGKVPFNEPVIAAARKDGKALIKDLDGSLKKSKFLCGDSVTIADISLACELVEAFRLVLDENTRKGYKSVVEWISRVFEIPEFQKVWGELVMCKTVNEVVPAVEEAKIAQRKKQEQGKKQEKAKKERKEIVVNKEEQERVQRERAEKKEIAAKAKLEQEEKKKAEELEKKKAEESSS